MPANYFEVLFYKNSQKTGRPCVRIVHKEGPAIDEDFKNWIQALLDQIHGPGCVIKSVKIMLPRR